MEKQVASNTTQLLLAESLEKWLGRQVLASFSLIRSSILVMKERAAFEMNWCYFGSLFVFGSPEISSLEFSRGGTFACPLEVCFSGNLPETHQEVVCHVRVLTSIAHWLHQIKFLPFIFYHRFLQCARSSSRPRPSLSRRPRRLRWCWCVYWIVSRRAFSNEIIVNTSADVFLGSVDSQSSCLGWTCMLLSIFLAFEVLLKKVTS